MKPVSHLVQLLSEAAEDQNRREQNISTFQNLVWNNQVAVEDNRVLDLLGDLALDLDYYEANSEIRREDPSYKDDAQAIADIRLALKNLESLGVVIPSSKGE